MTNLNIRLSGEKDGDIQREMDQANDKTARTKELIRKGIEFENTDVEQIKEDVIRLQKEKLYLSYKKAIVHVGDGKKSPIQHLF